MIVQNFVENPILVVSWNFDKSVVKLHRFCDFFFSQIMLPKWASYNAREHVVKPSLATLQVGLTAWSCVVWKVHFKVAVLYFYSEILLLTSLFSFFRYSSFSASPYDWLALSWHHQIVPWILLFAIGNWTKRIYVHLVSCSKTAIG